MACGFSIGRPLPQEDGQMNRKSKLATAPTCPKDQIPILEAVRGVGGVVPFPQKKSAQIFTWKVQLGARLNYRRLGKHLARRNGSLYRNGSHGSGLIHVGAS